MEFRVSIPGMKSKERLGVNLIQDKLYLEQEELFNLKRRPGEVTPVGGHNILVSYYQVFNFPILQFEPYVLV